MRIGVLTSSRADFGIYLPLLRALKDDTFFELEIIAFGTHLSNLHGYTVDQIVEQGFEVAHTVESMPAGDSADAIATSMGLTTIKFSSFWKERGSSYDYVICLGDRYEMFAAVTASIPFQIKLIHIHGGEKTMGAIDNIFRHSISHASSIHLTSTEVYSDRLSKMLDETSYIYNIGSLSLQNIDEIKLLSTEEFKRKWGVDLRIPTVLMTFHPETIDVCGNEHHAREIVDLIRENRDLQFIITMPNADTAGNLVRAIFKKHLSGLDYVKMFESMGTQSYFTAIKYCLMMMGNTSSGIIEAASFRKYVINLGSRQKGRAASENLFNTSIQKNAIQTALDKIRTSPEYFGSNIYFKPEPVKQVVEILKSLKNEQ